MVYKTEKVAIETRHKEILIARCKAHIIRENPALTNISLSVRYLLGVVIEDFDNRYSKK